VRPDRFSTRESYTRSLRLLESRQASSALSAYLHKTGGENLHRVGGFGFALLACQTLTRGVPPPESAPQNRFHPRDGGGRLFSAGPPVPSPARVRRRPPRLLRGRIQDSAMNSPEGDTEPRRCIKSASGRLKFVNPSRVTASKRKVALSCTFEGSPLNQSETGNDRISSR